MFMQICNPLPGFLLGLGICRHCFIFSTIQIWMLPATKKKYNKKRDSCCIYFSSKRRRSASPIGHCRTSQIICVLTRYKGLTVLPLRGEKWFSATFRPRSSSQDPTVYSHAQKAHRTGPARPLPHR